MPTLAVLDASLSMLVTASEEPGETKLSLALQGLQKFLTHISLCNKLELLSLAAFSSSFDVVFPFSRDYDGIKRHLETIEPCDVSCISVALSRLQSYIFHEWGHAENCQVIFITDGNLGFGRNSMVAKLASNQFSFNESFCFIPVLLIDPSEVTYATSIRTYNRMVELAGQGAVFSFNGDLTIDTVMSMFHRICEVYYAPFTGTITCGCLSETISLCPPPQPAVLSSDTVGRSLQMSSNLKVIGFVQLADLGNPPLLSRHLIVPRPESGLSVVPGDALKSEASTDEDLSIDEGKIPSFCVLLHASLKVENMAAFCQVADDWFGVIFSWADNKKKSNLMLGLLEPGSKSVPWYGDMNLLGPLSDLPSLENPSFPVRPSEKRSYATNVVTWSRPGSLQADVQKVVRHARKLPEKTHNFYKELNKLRKAALTLGFHELLDSLASLLEREGQILRGSAHPEASLQLGHAVQQLKLPSGKDPRHASIVPMMTSYGNE